MTNVIKLKVTTSEEREIDIPVPSFRRSKDERNYVGVLDEKTVVVIYNSEYFSLIKNTIPDFAQNDLKEAQDYHSCTEAEFLEKYDSVIESISLHPKLAV